MRKINLLPADTYIVVNKTILTDNDRKLLINLYEPIIGSSATSLYLTLWCDLDKLELMSKDFNHHHLMTILKLSLNDIIEAKVALEAVGLIKSYYKKGENVNSYIYELYSPLSAHEFFHHPILNVVLYNNIGVNEYEILTNRYKKPSFDLKDYEEITQKMNQTFKSTTLESFGNEDIQKREANKTNIESLIDFDLLIGSIPNKILNEKALNNKTKELINSLAFIYNIDTLKMSELLRLTIDASGMINKSELTSQTRKFYEYNNNGNLPTLIYRTQPDHLRSPEGDLSNRGKMLYIFENTTPYDFLRSKYKGHNPTARDLKLLEYLALELSFSPAVINVLIDYVLRINDNKLTRAFIETIAGQWTRLGIKTADEAMKLAGKEHKKTHKKVASKKTVPDLPSWFNGENTTSQMSEEEIQEIEGLLSEFK